MRVKFSLEPGIYGLSLLDDREQRRKMEYNFARLPKEGFGFSDYYHTGPYKTKIRLIQVQYRPKQEADNNMR